MLRGWAGKRVRLNVGASAGRPETWRDGTTIKEYVGGSSPIVGEITQAPRPGKNVVAAHVHQDSGGQFLDLALIASK